MSVWTRDLPSSFSDATVGWIERAKREYILTKNDQQINENEDIDDESPIELTTSLQTTKWDQIKTILFAGSGLFSDGYVNNSIGTASTCLSTLYPKEYADSRAINNVASIAFVGTVVGQLTFGYVSDKLSRKTGMIISNVILIIFTILCSGAWGYHGSIKGMLAALTAYRFFLGIGIGSEYPTGSVACAEASALMPPKHRNRYFIWFTNFAIDSGFVISSFVPMVLLWICTPKHLTPVWRITIGIGAIWPMILLCFRTTLKENENYQKTRFKKARIPYFHIIKFYWFRLFVVSAIWFIYDFSVYAFGIYSSYIIKLIIPDGDLYKTFGWNVVLNLFYIPGSFVGAIASDYFGPRLTLFVGLVIQAVLGFAIAGAYNTLKHHVAGFTVIYGFFLTFGEFGPGNNIGCLSAKTGATPIRGTYYAIPAAIGKIGAFVGTYAFPSIEKKYGLQVPYYIAGAMALFAAFLALFFLPDVSPPAMLNEDKKFLQYLESTGYDVSQLGDHSSASSIDEKINVETHENVDEKSA
ncbi:hypothetical protein DASC09_008110 [Saccharomycopsis crataegensis]|uniref:Major facilitator superfamily (MFS) profile domain-containing protein n=1 Tax=Saccharomycopsis crataegensis TaxID=43959 RepID=A0AAV5QFH8_9ASCO|nr:hypothetical protein DASC09_008110 [Saccharomycopsis crataegensis]